MKSPRIVESSTVRGFFRYLLAMKPSLLEQGLDVGIKVLDLAGALGHAIVAPNEEVGR